MSEKDRPQPSSDWLTLRQATTEFPLSKRILRIWISRGKLPSYRPFGRGQGSKILLKRSELDALIEAARSTPAASEADR